MTTPASRHQPPDIHRTAVNGCDIRYLRAGSGTPVVFVHTLRTQLEMFLQVIAQLDLHNAVFVGESIGASIGLILAARGNPRLAHVVAVNPYDYGCWGGARRSSPLNNVVFTTILWPVLGPIVARAGTKGLLRLVLAGGLYDRHNLPPALADEIARCGRLPGHARAFRSLCLQWRSWLSARAQYSQINLPVTL